MTSKRHETVVGVFVIVTLLILLAMVLVVAQQQRLWDKRLSYQAVFKNISGLKEGSEVRLSGVTVGSVTHISFDPKGNIVVRFEVLEQYRDRLREDSRATVGSIGLLGDMSLNITSGSPQVPVLPPGGTLPSTEPLELSSFLERATPALADAQKILANLVTVSDRLADPTSDVNLGLKEIKEIVTRLNQGKGTLGRILQDPKLFESVTQTIAGIDRFVAGLNSRDGLLGALLHDGSLKSQAQTSLRDLQASLEYVRLAAARIQAASTRLPGIADKTDAFLDQLNQAGLGLPELVTDSRGFITNADKVAEAAQKSWLLRRYVTPAKETTIVIDK